MFQDAGVLRIRELLDEKKQIQVSLGDGVSDVCLNINYSANAGGVM